MGLLKKMLRIIFRDQIARIDLARRAKAILPLNLENKDLKTYATNIYIGHAGIEMELEEQLEKLKRWKSAYMPLFGVIRKDPNINTQCFGSGYLHNGKYPTPDAEIYAAMIADFKPEHIIEIGIGYSTRIAKKILSELHSSCVITAIDPHPYAEVKGFADKILYKRVEEVSLEDLRVGPKTLFFIDSSHVTAAGGDVPFLYNQILPNLPSGTLVHVHDIFTPYDYPYRYQNLFYTEQYVLNSMLAHSERYRVIFSTHYMSQKFSAQMQDVFGEIVGKNDLYFGSSFWFEIK